MLFRSKLKELRDRIKEDSTAKSSQIESEITRHRETSESHRSNFMQLKNKIDGAGPKITECVNKIANSRSSISNLNQKLKIYQSNKCPHCLSDLTGENSTSIKSEIMEKIKSEEEILVKLTDIHKKATELLGNQRSQLDTEKSNYYQIQSSIKTLEDSLEKIKSGKDDSQEESIKSIIETISSQIEVSKSDRSRFQEEADLYIALDDILSDGGIKRMLIDRVIPLLNSRITEISTRLD